MSIITCNCAIVPAVWPCGLGRADTSPFDLQVEESWRYVPETFKGICDWATVAKEDDTDQTSFSHRHLVYQPSALPEDKRDTTFYVTVILQGFLGEFNISVLGNWKRRDRNPASAIQFLTLESGGVNDAFTAQLRALDNIRALISAKVGADTSHAELELGKITLQRRVFTREDTRESLLSSGTSTTSSVLGARRANGENVEIAHTALRCGDFVEVSAYADIQVTRRNRRIRTTVHFAMREVVRLWSVDDWKQHFTRTDLSAKGEFTGHLKVHEMPSGFCIGGSRDEDLVMEA
ncbi:hypothetical protein NUW54_g3119 [Trametes sanguinea]|uniref:Uncharacterized protein n=1 Tax=Trametes sanguinea TaxID=158606 RepID=A0ACC1Q486_9APHY|nr:hypothetical protein NUW54_g3119 [Trametes sanguinea]